MRRMAFLITGILCLLSGGLHAEEINVAVASNFTSAMRDIVTDFEAETGHKVSLSFGSSGKFFAQISHGAPFQAFLSADQAKPAKLEEAGFTVPGSRFTYAMGKLALWSKDDRLIDGSESVLKQGKFNKIALANPKLAPYGIAALETLKNLHLDASTAEKWVKGENIAQTFQFVDTGNAELGFVALSQVLEKGEIKSGSVWQVPTELHNPIKQDAVLLKYGRESNAARQLLDFMRSDKARAIIESYGYNM